MPKFLEVSDPAAAKAAINADQYVNARDFGAVGDNTTDDTTALQNWLDYLVANKRIGFLPNGVYKLTSSLVSNPAPEGFGIVGEHQQHTYLNQHANNTSILQIGTSANSTRQVLLENIYFNYQTPQSSGNTDANALVFVGPSGAGTTSIAYSTFRYLNFNNCYYAMKLGSASAAPWACQFDFLYMHTAVSGGFYDTTGWDGGAPNNVWGRMTLYCNSATGPIFKNWSTVNTTVDSIEFLQANSGAQLINAAAGFDVQFGSIKLEGGSYTGASPSLISLPGEFYIHIGRFIVEGPWLTAVFNPASGSLAAIYVPSAGESHNFLSIGTMDLSGSTVSATNAFGIRGSAANNQQIRVGNVRLANGWQFQDRSATGVAEKIRVDAWSNYFLSQSKGDEDYTVTITDPNCVHFSTAFTAQRTITLPTRFSNNLHNGIFFDLIFDGSINGANTAVIKEGSNTLRTQTQDKKVLRYMYRRSDWILVSVTDLNTGSTSADFTMGSIQLGHASDTTLSRASAGVLAVEGVAVPTVSSTSTFTNKTIQGTKETVHAIVDGAGFELDPDNGAIQTLTLGASRTPLATNFESGQSMTLIVAATSYTLTWTDATLSPSWVGGSAPALSNTDETIISLWKAGSTIYGSLVGYA